MRASIVRIASISAVGAFAASGAGRTRVWIITSIGGSTQGTLFARAAFIPVVTRAESWTCIITRKTCKTRIVYEDPMSAKMLRVADAVQRGSLCLSSGIHAVLLSEILLRKKNRHRWL